MTTISSVKFKTRSLAAVIGITVTLGLIGCGGGVETETDTNKVDPQMPVSDWEMVWNDEFDGDTIDLNKWFHEINCGGGGNAEQQCYTDSAENSFVADGILNIVAKPAVDTTVKDYTSARLSTKGLGDFKYGRFEMRAKLPSGQGSWPAFWLLPTDDVYGGWPNSGEIDIVESVNLKASTNEGSPEAHVYGTLHYGKDWPDNARSGKEYLLPEGANPADDFHTYAIEWQEGEIRWYVDGYLYETQMASEVRYNSKGQAAGLAHRGWFTEYFGIVTGELETHWDAAPFDQDFHMLLNFAVGGDWPENVNDTGIDPAAFADGQTFAIDYVRVYECSVDTETGKGCETVRPGYKNEDDALVLGQAPIPVPPSTGIAVNLTIFEDAENPLWQMWDCCGGSTPTVETDDAEHGAVSEFIIGEQATVMGYTTREGHGVEGSGPFDASPMIDSGSIKFDLKVVTAPTDASSIWMFKVESNDNSTAVELELTDSNEGVAPTTGEWQSYSFDLSDLADAGLDLSAIDVFMLFPAWDTGEGAVYHVDNVEISQAGAGSLPELVLFEDAANLDWAPWDCCAGSTPTEEFDDAEHGLTVEFSIGAQATVMGFKPADGSEISFDASALLADGVVQFDMKVVNAPNDASANWMFKIESNGTSEAVEIPITASDEGVAPVTGEWQTYTFKISDLFTAGLDHSAIDVIMIFPAWGAGEGAVYRVDNAKIYSPSSASNPPASGLTLFADTVATDWNIWDCCAGSTPTVEVDDSEHGNTAEFIIGSTATVMGFKPDDGSGVSYDASALLANGVVQFEMRVVNAPNDASSTWMFKIESGGTTAAVELPLTDSLEGAAPATGVWQTYTFTLQSLFDAGLDISEIDVVMIFPAWGTGEGAVYRVDNAKISTP